METLADVVVHAHRVVDSTVAVPVEVYVTHLVLVVLDAQQHVKVLVRAL